MKPLLLIPILILAALLGGCTTVNQKIFLLNIPSNDNGGSDDDDLDGWPDNPDVMRINWPLANRPAQNPASLQ